jgi:hypothetical protein
MFYRVASQKDPPALWRWESRVIASLDVLFRILWMYRSMPRYHLRVFLASSVERLDLMLDRESKGLASSSIPVDQFLQGRWSTNLLDVSQFESELRIRESMGILETSPAGEQSLHEKRSSTSSEGSADLLDRRRLEVELGAPCDHDTLYTFTWPTSQPQMHAWTKLLAKVQDGALQP